MEIISTEKKVIVRGQIPPRQYDTLVFQDLLDLEGTERQRVLVNTVHPLGGVACRITGTYLKNDRMHFVEAHVEHTKPGIGIATGIATFFERAAPNDEENEE